MMPVSFDPKIGPPDFLSGKGWYQISKWDQVTDSHVALVVEKGHYSFYGKR